MTKKTFFTVIGVLVLLSITCGVGFMLGFFTGAGTSASTSTDFGSGEAIALIRVEGVIQAGEPPVDVFGGSSVGAFSDRLVRQLKQANENDDVKAIVLRIDSPGGGVVASDEIYEQILALDKPVVVSMGTLAASGGYYISAPATEIWANRHTLTGSIGVIIQFINAEGLLEEYGVEANVVKSGTNKDTGSLFREMTEAEMAIWQAIIDEAYDVFVEIIVQGRGLEEATVRQLADGRVYTGQQALEADLVDKLGNLDDVIARAAELGGISSDEPRIIEYDQPASLFGGLFGTMSQPSPAQQFQELLNLQTNPTPMYLYRGE